MEILTYFAPGVQYGGLAHFGSKVRQEKLLKFTKILKFIKFLCLIFCVKCSSIYSKCSRYRYIKCSRYILFTKRIETFSNMYFGANVQKYQTRKKFELC